MVILKCGPHLTSHHTSVLDFLGISMDKQEGMHMNIYHQIT